jgi:glycosyltransferase involved in cell wall biosynthesis
VQDFVISIITVSFNAEQTIERCISSVINQKYDKIEYLIIDGGSTDGTKEIINKYNDKVSLIVSEPDKGIYDAMNKGIKLATGDIIGMLNADDFFADENILLEVADAFNLYNPDVLYGDLDYVDNSNKVIRSWKSGKYAVNLFNWGWMPPHPTFYCKRKHFEDIGYYSLNYGTAADYELMARFLYLNKLSAYYLKKVMVKMEIGGASNNSIYNRIKVIKSDYNAMVNNGIKFAVISVFLKPLRKISQFF